MKAGRIEALPGTFTPSSSAAAGKPEERSRSEAPVQMLVDGAALDNLEVGDPPAPRVPTDAYLMISCSPLKEVILWSQYSIKTALPAELCSMNLN